MGSKEYKYKFSVIIPIYNVEDYLEETIDSIVNQSIGFEDNIELILVNDGSPDNSEEICLKYKEKYPDNVKYIKQENSGVSAARNNGLKHAEGEFINFLDSDDKWSLDTFEDVYNNYQEHPDIKLFSCKMIFFDGRQGNHILNYKYKSTRIINILDQYNNPQLSSCSIFIHRDAIKNHSYDESIKYSEDNRLINEMILENKYYMVLKNPIYYYRRRLDVSSAIQNQIFNESYYNVTPKKVYQYLFDYSKKIYGRIIPYVQCLILYDLNYRITIDENNTLVSKEYINTFISLIKQMDDYIIINNKSLDLAKKVFLMSIKHDKDYKERIDYYFGGLQFEGTNYSRKNLGFLILDNTIFSRNNMVLYGKLDTKFISQDKFIVLKNNERIKVEYYKLANNSDELTFNHDYLHKYLGIKITIPIDSDFKLSFYYKDLQIIPRFKRTSVFNETLPASYHCYNNKVIHYHNGVLTCENINRSKILEYEKKNIKYLYKIGKKKTALIRKFIYLSRPLKRKKIMLISDRINKADDNGEHFFKYMVNNHKNINTYFVLSKDSADYSRLKKIGKVLDPNSNKYKLLFQISDYIVSSHAENYIFAPLGNSSKFVHDQYYFKYIFLQHGITKDDLSPWININTKKMDMFVTAAKPEYNSILEYNYGFNKDIVKLTGFPRFDTLLDRQKQIKVKKQILLSFTWRNSLTSKIDKETGQRLYNEDFKNSEYFKTLDKIMNDKKLIEALKKNDYQIKLVPHPNVLCQLQDFTENDYIKIEKNPIDYQKEFCENALLITDYSSIFFDFAYLKKPIICYQFDREEFYKNQVYNKGYFNYDTDCFGPVFTKYDSFIDEIIKTVENGCQLDKKYENRINNFYTYNDKNNCERVYNEIMNLK